LLYESSNKPAGFKLTLTVPILPFRDYGGYQTSCSRRVFLMWDYNRYRAGLHTIRQAHTRSEIKQSEMCWVVWENADRG